MPSDDEESESEHEEMLQDEGDAQAKDEDTHDERGAFDPGGSIALSSMFANAADAACVKLLLAHYSKHTSNCTS